MAAQWVWTFLICRLRLQPHVAECVLWHGVAFTDMPKPENFFKQHALRLGWIEEPIRDGKFVLRKRRSGPDDPGGSIPSVWALNDKYEDRKLALSFFDTTKQGFFGFFDSHPRGYLIDSTWTSRTAFHFHLQRFLACISDPGDFPADMGGYPLTFRVEQ